MDEKWVEEEGNKTPSKKAAPKKSSSKKSSAKQSSVKLASVKKVSTKKKSAKKSSTGKTLVKKTSTEKSSAKKTSVKNTSLKKPVKKINVKDSTSEKAKVEVAVSKKSETESKTETEPETRATVPIWKTEKTPTEPIKSTKLIKPTKSTTQAKLTKPIAPAKPKRRYRKWPIVLMALVTVGAILWAVLYVLWNVGPADDIKINFSKETGLYDTDIEVELSSNGAVMPPATEIRYTLDGDSPVTNGKTYTEPIKLGMSELVNAIPVKATYCYAGGKCGKVYTQTYILATDPEKDITLDIISITSDHDNLYDYEKGIFVKGKVFDDNVAAGMDPGQFVPGNSSQRSDEWIRDAHVVLLDHKTMKAGTDDGILWDQEVGIQTSGGTSVADVEKSIKLVANKKYGYDKLAYSFSPSGDSTVGLAIPKKYNSLRLRAGGQDKGSGNIRSSLVSRLAEESGFDGYSATKRAAVFLNGKFYFLADVQQNYSDSFLAKRFGLAESDDIQKIKLEESKAFSEAGLTGLFERDLEVPANREALEKMVDMDDYLLYFALEILWNNTDWPGNSFEIWRYNGPEVDGNKYSDGRWRFLIYDTDLIYYRKGNAEYFEGVIGDQFEALMEKKYRGEKSAFSHVMESSYYRNKFVQILKELLNGPFTTENVIKIIDEETQKIEPSMRVYYDKQKYEDWKKQITLMKRAVVEQNQRIIEDAWTYFRVLV